MFETWLPTVIAAVGSFISGYFGIRVGMARMEERHIALMERVSKIESRMDAKDLADYHWRHDEYSPMITSIWADLHPLKTIVERLERFRHNQKN